MEKYKLISVLVIIALCVTSCSGDDENLSDPNAPKKRITQIVTKWGGNAIKTAKFEYAGDKVSKVIVTAIGENQPWITEFEYNGNELKQHYTNLWFEGEPRYTNVYTLNSDGYVSSYKHNEDSQTYKYSNGYLVLVEYSESTRNKDEVYKYDKDWNMISNPELENITYTNTLNIGGLYLAYDGDGGMVIPRLWTGLMGKASSYLPKESKEDVSNEGLYTYYYKYDLDKDGYVSVVHVTTRVKELDSTKDVPFDWSWTETFSYEVIQ